MTELRRIAASRPGSALLFGGAMFVGALAEDGFSSALSVAGLSALSWFAFHPLLDKAIRGTADAR